MFPLPVCRRRRLDVAIVTTDATRELLPRPIGIRHAALETLASKSTKSAKSHSRPQRSPLAQAILPRENVAAGVPRHSRPSNTLYDAADRFFALMVLPAAGSHTAL
jgi:hypothetical protein